MSGNVVNFPTGRKLPEPPDAELPRMQVVYAGGTYLVLTMYVAGRLSADLLLPGFVASYPPIEGASLVNVVTDTRNAFVQPPMEGCEVDPWTLEVGEATFYLPSEAEASRIMRFLAKLPGDRRA